MQFLQHILPYLVWVAIIVPLAALILFFVVVLRASRLSIKPPRRRGYVEFEQDLSERAAESLSEMVKFKTISSPTYPSSAYLSALLRQRDYIKNRYPAVNAEMEREMIADYSIVYRWKGEKDDLAPLLFCAHLDVVPAEGEWEYDPFSGDIADGEVHGRGTLDCKNILVCLLEAAESLIKSGFRPQRDIYFAFGHDEEIGGMNGASNIARYFEEKGLRFEMVLDEGGAIQRGYMGVKRPVASVAVTEKGFMTVKMTARSSGGHSSTPPRHSAIGMLAEAVCRVEYKPMKPKLLPVMEEQLRRLAPYVPSRTRIMIANLWLLKGKLLKKMSQDSGQNALIRTTIASTMANAGTAHNVLPQSAEVILNLRPIHGDSCRKLANFISELVRGLGVEVEILRENDASKISDFKSEAFRKVETAIIDCFGEVIVIPGMMTGGTDSRKYEDLCDNVYRFCPFVMTAADMAKVHAAKESVKIESLGTAVEFYKHIIRDF